MRCRPAGRQLLHERCNAVVCGFSLGGLLGLHLAAREPMDGRMALAQRFDCVAAAGCISPD